MRKVSDVCGAAVFAPRRRRGASGTFEQLGKVHLAVFAPGGRRVCGFLVKRPDVAGMVRRPDVFVALDALAPCDGGLRVTRGEDAYDDAARARLGLDWDACVVWTGMDAVTERGRELGYVSDATFDAATGAVGAFVVGDGGVARSLVGSVEVPAEMLRGYDAGRMVVADEAATLALSGGLAGKAGAAAGKAQVEGAKAAAKAGKAAGKAAALGSRALGRQLGKTRGMFGAFVDEYKKASS